MSEISFETIEKANEKYNQLTPEQKNYIQRQKSAFLANMTYLRPFVYIPIPAANTSVCEPNAIPEFPEVKKATFQLAKRNNQASYVLVDVL